MKELTAADLQLVQHRARRFAAMTPAHIDRAELVSAGQLGLVDAAQHWRPDSAPWEWYAQRRIDGAIQDYLRSLDPMTRAERHALRTGEEVEEITLCQLSETHDLPGRTADDARVDAHRIIGRLKLRYPQEALVLELHYLHDQSLVEVGEQLGVKRSRACQLKHAALAHAAQIAGAEKAISAS